MLYLASSLIAGKREEMIALAPSFSFDDLNSGFVVAIAIRAKEGEGEAVAAILEGLVAPTMAEPGVKIFVPYRSPCDPLSFFLFELYDDRAAWDAHQATRHFKEAIEVLLPLAAERERVPYVPYVCAA